MEIKQLIIWLFNYSCFKNHEGEVKEAYRACMGNLLSGPGMASLKIWIRKIVGECEDSGREWDKEIKWDNGNREIKWGIECG